jgi:protein TonB
MTATNESPPLSDRVVALKAVAAAPPAARAVASAAPQGAAAPGINLSAVASPAGDVQFGSATGPAWQERAEPVYPTIARKFGKEGKVVLRLSIDEKGNMTGVEVISDPGYGFVNAAIEALKKSSFSPARIAGRAVTVKAILPIRFSLHGTD